MKINNDTNTIKLIAKRPRKIKTALAAWIAASDKVNSDPLGLDDAPPWVEKAWIEVAKTVMPGNRLPASGDLDLESLGALLGRLQAFSKLLSGEIPMAPQVKVEFDRFTAFAKSQPQSPERTDQQEMLAKDLETRINAVQPAIPNVMGAAMVSSYEDSLKFQKGLLRGMRLSQDKLITANAFERHTRTFFVLALYWRFWVTCKSLGEIHRILCQAVGENKIGSFRTFENRVAKKIGLKIRGPGRPSGKK